MKQLMSVRSDVAPYAAILVFLCCGVMFPGCDTAARGHRKTTGRSEVTGNERTPPTTIEARKIPADDRLEETSLPEPTGAEAASALDEVVPETGLQRLDRLKRELRSDIDLFVQDLDGPLDASGLAEVVWMKRLNSPPAFLREFRLWLSVPGRKELLTPELHFRLTELEERWEWVDGLNTSFEANQNDLSLQEDESENKQ